MNQFKTFLLLGLLTGLLVLVGGALGGRTGMIIALVLAAGMNFFSYWYSDRIVLKMYRAQEINESQAPGIYSLVRELAQKSGLPMPRVYLIEDHTPNAFATGRDPNHAVVAVTRGIVELLSERELRGVLAHELGHVKNRDILVGTVAATLAGAIMVLANMARFAAFFGGGRSNDDEGGGGGVIGMLAMAIIAPLAAMLVQMAVSRSREYLADATGAETSGDPAALASALAKLESANRAAPMRAANAATAHMFTVNPLSGGFASLFSTHPPIPDRIARLSQMAGRPLATSAAPGRGRTMTPPPPPLPPRDGAERPFTPQGGPGGKIDWS